MSPFIRELATARLALEPLTRAHAPALFNALERPEVYRYIAADPRPSQIALEERYARLETRRSPDDTELWLNWAVRERTEQALIGLVQATIRPSREALLAFLFAPEHQGLGYATESCRHVITELSSRYAVTRISATVDTRNIRSIRLLNRLGFRQLEERPSADLIGGLPSREILFERGGDLQTELQEPS